MATAYDGIYIEALYESVPFFLKQPDVFPLTNVQMLNDLRKFGKYTEPLLMKRVEKQLEDFGGPDLLNLSLRTVNRRLHKIVCMKAEAGEHQGAGNKKLVFMTLQYSPHSQGVIVPESFFAELLVGGYRNSASVIADWNASMGYYYCGTKQKFVPRTIKRQEEQADGTHEEVVVTGNQEGSALINGRSF